LRSQEFFTKTLFSYAKPELYQVIKMREQRIALILLLILSFAVVYISQIRVVKAESTIYIRADGSVEGTDKIQRNGNVYTFVGNISVEGTQVDGIIVEKDNIVIDGAGYTLQYMGNLSYLFRGINGINLTARNGITIKNMRIIDFVFNVQLHKSSNNTILSNYISTSELGITLSNSHNNSVIQNEVVSYGENMFSMLNASSPNIQLFNSSSNTISANYVYTKEIGIDLVESHNNRITQNNLVSNGEGSGITFYRYSVNDTGSGNSFNNTISGNAITEQGIGIKSLTGSKNIVSGNNITDCKTYGIFLENYQQINVVGNNFENNTVGIFLGDKASNNTIHHNNFINNQKDVTDVRSTIPFLPSPKSIWDTVSRGNYWSSYNGTDNNGDGIGDSPHLINDVNQDNYPLMNPVDIEEYIIPEFPSWTPTLITLIAGASVIAISRRRLRKKER
jgi:parallel beta-helix repeat protein